MFAHLVLYMWVRQRQMVTQSIAMASGPT